MLFRSRYAGQWRGLRHPLQSRQVDHDAVHPDWQWWLNKLSGLRLWANTGPTQAAQDGLAVETGALIADTQREGFPSCWNTVRHHFGRLGPGGGCGECDGSVRPSREKPNADASASRLGGRVPLISFWIPEWPFQTNPCKNLYHLVWTRPARLNGQAILIPGHREIP